MRTSVDEHATRIRELVRIAPRSDTVPLLDALDRVTVAEIVSPVDLPLFRNSQMDGFAVRASDVTTTPVALPIAGVIPAAAGTPLALEPGTAVRIMTGAPVPDGADAVIPVEDTTVDGSTVTIGRSRAVGEYVRERGSDVSAGTQLLPAGLRLAPRHLAALAAAGITTIDVRARVRVAVVTTGTELVAPGVAAAAGEIHDANAVALAAAVAASGAVVSIAMRASDDASAFLSTMSQAAADSDVIVTSGGISMGDFEVVREFLEPRGGQVTTIAMQPGGPQATALVDGVPVVSFPGNPVSTQISFEVFLAPLLREIAGLPAASRETRPIEAAVDSVPGKRQFLRGRLTDSGGVALVAGPGSHLVAGLAASDVLIDIPENTTEIAAGAIVEVLHL